MKIALVAVAYNRVNSLSRLLDSLSKAFYTDNNISLIISVDKSRSDEVEKFADSYLWKHGIKIVDKHEKNLGLRQHMFSLGKWFDQFDALIVLEDDIVVSESFYLYATQVVNKYYDCKDIAGISLYGSEVLHTTGLNFSPLKTPYDIYFVQCAISWGQIWMKKSWLEFYEWYKSNESLQNISSEIPQNVLKWDSRSWLKYHQIYCVEKNKFFVFPYVSMSTNVSEIGEHAKSVSNVFQVSLMYGKLGQMNLPEFNDDALKYDIFFENIQLYNQIQVLPEDLCIDLNGAKKNIKQKRFWLTTEQRNYKIVDSYSLSFRPIEVNVLKGYKGNDIFLYDTTIEEKHRDVALSQSLLLYNLHFKSIVPIIRIYGFYNTISAILNKIICRFKIK